jgi:hypothetical protein
MQNSKPTKLGRTTHFVPINLALSFGNFVITCHKQSRKSAMILLITSIGKSIEVLCLIAWSVKRCRPKLSGQSYRHFSNFWRQTCHRLYFRSVEGPLSWDTQRECQIAERESSACSREELENVVKINILSLFFGSLCLKRSSFQSTDMILMFVT